jgi:hypothetical protein
MTLEELDRIRSWDKRCGDLEGTFFPVTLDRRRLLEYVDELRAELAQSVVRLHSNISAPSATNSF